MEPTQTGILQKDISHLNDSQKKVTQATDRG